MRIVIVNSGLRYGGAEKQIIELSKELVRRGHTVAIYTLTDDVPRLGELDGSGIAVIVDNKRKRLDLAVIRRLRRFLTDFGADVVHGFLFDGNIYSRLAGAGLGIPVLNSERNADYQWRPIQVWANRLTRPWVNAVVANSHAGKRFAEGLFGLPPERVELVWNGIRVQDVEARMATPRQDPRLEFFGDLNVKLACLVGTILESKDHLLALDVAASLVAGDSPWRVLFIGDTLEKTLPYESAVYRKGWDYRDRVMGKFAEMSLGGKVCFAGQRADALEIIGRADVLYSTSVHEGFPNVVLEAMAAGTPAVATDYSDIRRILPFEWQVVADRVPEKLVGGILRAEKERDAVIAAQRQFVIENATIEAATQSLLSVYSRYVKELK